MCSNEIYSSMQSLRPGIQWSRQIGRSAKPAGNAPQLSRRNSEPISELQDLLYLVRENRN